MKLNEKLHFYIKSLLQKPIIQDKDYLLFKKNGKYGVVDITDKIILKAQYNQIVFLGNRYILVHSNGYKQGLYSTSGKEIIALGDYDLRVDGDGYKTEIEKEDNPHDYYTFATISYNKQWIDNSSFMKMFDSSVIKIIDIKNDTFGYIYKNNDELILEPIYKNIELIKSGVGIIRTRNDKYGLINKQYRIILEPKYDLIITHNPYDIFIVSIFDNKDNSISGLVNLKGEIVLPISANWIMKLEKSDNIYMICNMVENKEAYTLFDNNKEKYIGNMSFDEIIEEDKNIFKVKYNNKYGLIDNNGKYIFEKEYDNIEVYKKMIKVDKYFSIGLADYNGNFILNREWQSINIVDNFIIFTKNKQSGVMNLNKKLLLEYGKYWESSIKIRKHPKDGKPLIEYGTLMKTGLIDSNGNDVIPLMNNFKYNLVQTKFFKEIW